MKTNALKETRTQKGLTQEDVAKKVGVTQATVSFWENGTLIPGGKHLKALKKEFGIDPAEMLGV